MRDFKPQKNAQKKVYYSDRFYQKPTIPRESLEHYAEFASELAELTKEVQVLDSYVERGDWVVYIAPKDNRRALKRLQDMGYEVLSELSAIDYLESRNGFEVFYQLLSLKGRRRMRVKLFLNEGECLESVQDLYRAADWSEREMYDMFGISVLNHPYLKRLLMPDDWSGYPLRKSYPLQGDEAAQWYEVDKIFGREYRDVIGAENRDSARIDRYDTERFARIGHEVPYGEEPKTEETPIAYQENKGVTFVRRLKPEKSKNLKERK